MKMEFGHYTVIKQKKGFVGIYKYGTLITHKNNWRQATKLAKMLHEAYMEGVRDYY
jgi:hypothetical protein